MASGGPLDWIRPDRGIARSLHGQSLLGSERPGLPRGSGVAGRVASFAPMDASSGWVHLDFASERTSAYDHVTGRVVDRTGEDLLRDIRLPTEQFLDGLVLTNYGRHLRWGPGSWIDQPPHRDSTPQQRAIAEQLRLIRDNDPSQVLRRPNP